MKKKKKIPAGKPEFFSPPLLSPQANLQGLTHSYLFQKLSLLAPGYSVLRLYSLTVSACVPTFIHIPYA